MTLFKLNKDSAIPDDLKRIFLKTESFGRFIGDNLEEIGNIRFALIDGSFAKGRRPRQAISTCS